MASPPFSFDLTHASMFVFWKLPSCCTLLTPIHSTPLIIHHTKKSFTASPPVRSMKLLIQGTKPIWGILQSSRVANLKRCTQDQMIAFALTPSVNENVSQGGGNVLAVNLLVSRQIIARLSRSRLCQISCCWWFCWVDAAFSLPLLMLAWLLCKKISVCWSTSPSVTLAATHTHAHTHTLITCISDGNYSFLMRIRSSGSVPFWKLFKRFIIPFLIFF